MGLLLAFLLKPRFPALPKPVTALLVALTLAVPTFIRATHPGTALYTVVGFIQIGIIVCCLIVFYKDIWWKKLLALLLFMSMVNLSGNIVNGALTARGVPNDVSYASFAMFLHQTLTCVLSVILFMILMLVWNVVFKKAVMPHNTWIFLLFPLSQLLIFWNLSDTLPGAKKADPFFITGAVLGFAADIAFFYVLFSESERAELKRRVGELDHLWAVEKQHFENIEQQDLAIAKIRHDINNQLTTAMYLNEHGAAEKSKQLLQQIQSTLRAVPAGRWCGNQIVNAVLSEKEAVWKAKGITLLNALDIDELPAIQPVHLCSAFSNLLDNAIEAAAACPEGHRTIEVHAARQGDYLQIRVCNSSARPAGRLQPATSANAHGHGQEILKSIAAIYDGSFLTDWKDGIYTAILALDLTCG
jgi:hypothetical protein